MGLDWTDLFAALAIVCIIEGIMPFINPSATRRLLARMAAVDEREMRIVGLVSMLVGLAILYMVRS
ncbi:MAG TPA: DUF2065 domain-containing protein [Steroidobacteraceae bacterium]